MPMHRPVHPGRIIRNTLAELGLAMPDAAVRLGMSEASLAHLVG